jgi:hypothetical protein
MARGQTVHGGQYKRNQTEAQQKISGADWSASVSLAYGANAS